jgi:hypothetical protein
LYSPLIILACLPGPLATPDEFLRAAGSFAHLDSMLLKAAAAPAPDIAGVCSLLRSLHRLVLQRMGLQGVLYPRVTDKLKPKKKVKES